MPRVEKRKVRGTGFETEIVGLKLSLWKAWIGADENRQVDGAENHMDN
jgi:hypothetical protein